MIRHHRAVKWALGGAMLLAPLSACESLPGSNEQQGAVIGGVAGGAAGAAIASDNRVLGALIGALVGAGGGYLIGANVDRIRDTDEDDRQAAQEAVDKARTDPATAQDVRDAATADLNSDGFVTMDEVTAMSQAGLGDREILDRLEATNQVFELTDEQERTLVRGGVSPNVVEQMQLLNQDQKQEILQQRQDVLNRPA